MLKKKLIESQEIRIKNQINQGQTPSQIDLDQIQPRPIKTNKLKNPMKKKKLKRSDK